MDWYELGDGELAEMRTKAKAKVAKIKYKMMAAEAALFDIERMQCEQYLRQQCNVRVGGTCWLVFYDDGPCAVIIEGISRRYHGGAEIEFRIIGKKGKPWKSKNSLGFNSLNCFRPMPSSPSAGS